MTSPFVTAPVLHEHRGGRLAGRPPAGVPIRRKAAQTLSGRPSWSDYPFGSFLFFLLIGVISAASAAAAAIARRISGERWSSASTQEWK